MGPTVFIHLIVFGSALAASISGYGFVLLASPLLLLLLPPAEAVPLSILLGWTVPLILLTRSGTWRLIARPDTLRLVAAGIPGIPIGAWLLFTLDAVALRVALGLTVSSLAVINLRGLGGRASAASEAPERLARGSGGAQRPPAIRTFLTGFLAGIMSGAAGLSGPLTTLYLSRFPLDKHRLRATTASTILLLSSVTLSVYAVSGRIPPDLGLTALSLLPALGAGMFAGSRIFHALPERRFRQATLAFAGLAGLGTAISALASRSW